MATILIPHCRAAAATNSSTATRVYLSFCKPCHTSGWNRGSSPPSFCFDAISLPASRLRPSVRKQSQTYIPRRKSATQAKSRQKSTVSIPTSTGPSFTRASRDRGTATTRGVFKNLRDSFHAALLKPRTLPLPRWVTPRHYSVTLSECFGHASFILVAASYAVDDFLMLRCIAVVGSTAMLFFTYFHPHGRVLWLPLKWNLLFIATNSYRIGKVFWDRFMAGQLSSDMLDFRENHFYIMDPVEFFKLVRLGTEETYEEGDLIVTQGSMNRYIRLVISGELSVLRDGQETYLLGEGNFVSEAGLHAGLLLSGTVESCASVIAASGANSEPGKVRLMRWDRTELMELLREDKGLRRSIKAALSWDIIRKLKGQRQMLASGKIEDAELWTQKRNSQNEQRYAAILMNMLQHPDFMNKRRDELDKYRKIHHIDDEHHRLALEHCGWTPEEFELGRKLVTDDEDDEEEDDEQDKMKRQGGSTLLSWVLG